MSPVTNTRASATQRLLRRLLPKHKTAVIPLSHGRSVAVTL